MKKYQLILLLVSLFFTGFTFGQQQYKFNNRVEKFPKELNEFMSDKIEKERKDQLEKLMESFTLMWMSDTLSDLQKKNIINMCNGMSQKRMRPFPHFNQYVNTILGMVRNPQGKKLFDDWFRSLEPLVSQKSYTNFISYLELSEDIFKSNILCKSSIHTWYVSNMDIKIDADEKNPKYIFNEVELKCVTKTDSGFIYHTSGTYYPLQSLWEGKNGRIDWRRVKIPENQVYADLNRYKIKLKGTKFIADTVTFVDSRRFGFPLKGRLSERIFSSLVGESNYPQFVSFETNLTISEVFKDVDYQGGYSLQGNRVIGSGSEAKFGDEEKEPMYDANGNEIIDSSNIYVGAQLAYFIFKRNGKPIIYTGAHSFTILPDRISAEKVTVTIKIKDDSIYHPGLSMTFLDKKRELTIFRMDKGLSLAPFFDSYHNLDMFVESIVWKMGEDFIDMKMIQLPGSVSESYFESVNYFSRLRYDRLQGLDRINPVQALYNLTKKLGSNKVYVEDYGRELGMGPDIAMTLLMNLATKGFVIYDVTENSCIVKDRVETYVNAFKGRVDYDVISFRSVTEGIPNASLNLINDDLMIQGVKNVQLSDSQQVYIYPKNQRIIVKKNRDFVFDGLIKAGRFDLYARECAFSYDKFELDMPVIDSLSFKVKSFEENEYGDHTLVRVKTVIEDLKGNILLDNPNNKSGRKQYAEYPILNSKSNSYVYYNRSDIFNGIYSKDKFYYRLEAFTIDSLDDFETEGLEFKGYLNSAKIFPDIYQPLKVQKDYSLGFITETGIAGMNAYGGKGKFTDKIMLSNEGLRGNGNLKYLTSTAWSDNFYFFPDSTLGITQKFKIEERKTGIEYPDVVAENTDLNWKPYQDILTVNDRKKDNPMLMYAKEAKLHGELNLTPKLLYGSGTIAIKEAEMDAKLYRFKNLTYKTDTCSFRLKKFVDNSLGMGELASTDENAYSTEGFKSLVDFKLRKAEFESNGGSKKVSFPENQYICFMDKFTWYMDKDETEFASSKAQIANIDKMALKEVIDLDLTGSEFISVHPDQDSLKFFAQRATFSRQKATIKASDVKMIRVADASVFPEKGKVNIYRNAEMEEFKNAIIIANTVTKYHTIKNSTVTIKGRKSYYGRGLYDYKDEDGNVENIYFTEITVDTTGTSHAKGLIDEKAKFTLSADFDFVGDVKLIANKEFLRFEGGTRIKHECDTLAHDRLYFEAFINPADIQIPVDEEPKTTEHNDMFTSIILNDQGTAIYPAFLSKAGKRTDDAIIKSSGVLVYDKISQEYRISTPDKLKQMSLPDNFISLSKRSCMITGEGKVNLGFDLSPVTVNSYGRIKHFMRQDSTDSYVAMAIDFYFNEKAIELMAEDINKNTSSTGVNLDDDINKIALGQILGVEATEKLMSEVATQGGAYKRVPKEIAVTMYLTNVNMKWNPRTRSFVSQGKIGIGNMGKTQINKYVDGIVMIKNKRGNSELTIAIQLAEDQYYFFTYNSQSGIMGTWSSNNDFITIIKDTKVEDRRLKVKDKEDRYQYYLSAATTYKKFLRDLEIKGQ